MPDRLGRRLDRVLVLAAAALVGAIAWTSLSPGNRRAAAPAPAPTTASSPAPVPEDVRLVPSSTAFLPHCPLQDLHLSVGADGVLTLRFAGSPCHVPPLHLRATERDASGSVVYRGPALSYESLSGNFAVSAAARGRLLGPCGPGPLDVTVSGSGLHATGTVRC